MVEATRSQELPRLLAPVEGDLERVEAWLEARLADGPPKLRPLLDHAARFRGKRLRAAQVFLVARACGDPVPDHLVVAGIVEMIHLATLAHDDLLDDATRRRGMEALHLRWGAHAAVLLGDWIYSKAFRISTRLEDQTCTRVLADATGRVCEGEIQQNLARGDFDLSEEDYLEQVDGKTAALFEAAGRLAAHYAGADEAGCAAAARHGLLAGRAFQIIDDVLDLEADAAKVGKSVGSDWEARKMTLPLIRLREALGPEERARLREGFAGAAGRAWLFAPPFAEATRLALEECRREAEEQLGNAVAALEGLPQRESVSQLAALTRFLGTRQR